MVNKSFKSAVTQVLDKYQHTSLSKRWQDAISFGEREGAQSYWIRDSEDVVNIVWLCSDGIRDITWSPRTNETMFNYVPLKNILTIETREMINVARQHPGVTGDFAVRVILGGQHGDLWWVAENEDTKQRLRNFLTSVLANCTRTAQ